MYNYIRIGASLYISGIQKVSTKLDVLSDINIINRAIGMVRLTFIKCSLNNISAKHEEDNKSSVYSERLVKRGYLYVRKGKKGINS